jgi:methionine-rich copper-binding protein CopC
MKQSFARRVAMSAFLAAGLYSTIPSVVQAHATLVKCSITVGATYRSAPRTVTCTFAEGVNPKGSFIGVFQATGDKGEVDKQDSSVPFTNAKQLAVGLPSLARGSYNLIWFTISANDGHRAGGYFTFAVK